MTEVISGGQKDDRGHFIRLLDGLVVAILSHRGEKEKKELLHSAVIGEKEKQQLTAMVEY